jgi:hypothetical protein
MKAENLYHTGIVVDDIEATMAWLAKVAGNAWTDVVSVDQEAVTPDGEVTVPLKMVYSGAEPRLELLQTVPGTVGVRRPPRRTDRPNCLVEDQSALQSRCSAPIQPGSAKA